MILFIANWKKIIIKVLDSKMSAKASHYNKINVHPDENSNTKSVLNKYYKTLIAQH